MTRTEHLLTILAEECVEVAQRATKALRFGLKEIQDGQVHDNASRLRGEFADLVGVYNLLVREGLLEHPSDEQIAAKPNRIELYLNVSRTQGTLI